MIRVTILKKNIDDEFWPKFVLVMIYINNNCTTKALLSNITLHKAQNQEKINVSHLYILGSTVYVFLHKEKRSQ